MESVLNNTEPKLGSLMYMSLNNFFADFMRTDAQALGDYEILIISKDIIADRWCESMSTRTYKSRYEHVDFAPELFPTPDVLEYLYGSSRESFSSLYKTQLNRIEQMKSLCSIMDLVLNDGYKVIIVCSHNENSMGYFDVMREFIFEKFGYVMTDFKDIKEGKELPNENTDIESMRKTLKYLIAELELFDEDLGDFFNKFTTDMANDYKDILLKKSMDELVRIGAKKGIHVNRHKPKEFIVDHILSKLVGDEPKWQLY